MQNPRAVRRAEHLRRLGLIPPPEPAPVPAVPVAAPAHNEPRSGKKVEATGVVLAAAGMRQGPPSRVPESGATERPAHAAAAKPGQPDAASHGPTSSPTGAAGADTGGKPAATQTASSEGRPHETKPAGDQSAGPAVLTKSPIWLRAHVDNPHSEYQTGQWVTVRFLASQPVHLRVYRVDAAGHVTRVFSTYSKVDQGSPARTFSMMVKAGEPRPGPEGMVAIGSARPLTRDELLACLRASLAEGPSDSTTPGGSGTAAAPAGKSPDAAPPVAPGDALKAVIDAVGNAADLPEAAAAPLDRSAWSIAIGRFISADRKLSSAGSPAPAKVAAEGS
jgi:hypothetical protein